MLMHNPDLPATSTNTSIILSIFPTLVAINIPFGMLMASPSSSPSSPHLWPSTFHHLHKYTESFWLTLTSVPSRLVGDANRVSKPLWNFSSRNRVTPVSIQDGVQHGITFAAISTIPAAPSPISAELSPISAELTPIPAALSRSLRRSADARSPIVARLAKHHKTLLNIVKHHETHVKHCKTS